MTGSPRPTRALLTTMDFPPSIGGIQTVAHEICARARSTAIRVVAPDAPGAGAFDEALGLPVRRVRRFGGPRGLVPVLALATRAEARRTNPDVVLALHVLAAPGALSRGVPTVVAVYGGELRSPRIQRIARRVLPRAHHVVAISRYTLDAAVALGASPERSTIVPVGAPDPIPVPAETIAALRATVGGGRVVLSVARLEPHKGHDRLIAALPSLDADVRLVLVGEGTARAELERQAASLRVADRVHFAGAVDDARLPAFFAAADVFALMTRETSGPRGGVEGGGIAILEAFAYRVPVVAAATGAIPETVRDEETGLLVDPEEGSSVVRGLHRLLTERALADRLADAGHALATEERSWRKFVEQIETIVERVARGRERA